MSLLTDALRLREGRRSARGSSGPSIPPFRGPRPGRWILAALGICLLGMLVWWKGAWMMEGLEHLAGIPPNRLSPNLLASAKTVEVPPSAPPAPVSEGTAPVFPREEKTGTPPGPVPTAVAGETGNLQDKPVSPEGPGPTSAAQAEGKVASEFPAPEKMQPEDSRPKENRMDTVAEKPSVIPAPVPPAEIPVAAPVPGGGLQPMKVDLVATGLMLESPEVREKKRVEKVEEFLRLLKVQGVRLQGEESRILVDGAPIGLGEKVGSLGLVLESVEPQKIIFSDASGKKYPKSY